MFHVKQERLSFRVGIRHFRGGIADRAVSSDFDSLAEGLQNESRPAQDARLEIDLHEVDFDNGD